MSPEATAERLFESLINGDRPACRALIAELADAGTPPEDIVTGVFWPAYESLAKLHRADQLSTLGYHLGTRLLRVLCDQAAREFTPKPIHGRSVFAVCGPTDADELGAQIATDLLERDGYDVRFAGGGIAIDEILAHIQRSQPDALVLFASAPSDLPDIRHLIDTMHEIGACRQTQIIVGGGVFNRAEGLAEEIGADLWANDPLDLVEAMNDEPERRAEDSQRTVGRKRIGRQAA